MRNFHKIIKPYTESGMIRIINLRKHFAIISLGEILYVACPYILSESEYVVGVYMNQEAMIKLLKKEKIIYPVLNAIFNDFDNKKGILFQFTVNEFDYCKKWIEENQKVFTKKIDPEFEEWMNKKYKSIRI